MDRLYANLGQAVSLLRSDRERFGSPVAKYCSRKADALHLPDHRWLPGNKRTARRTVEALSKRAGKAVRS